MCPLRKTNLAALLLAILCSTAINYGCKNLYADEKRLKAHMTTNMLHLLCSKY
jgi:hypothetical protein